MRAILTMLAVSVAAVAQQPSTQTLKTYASASEVAALTEKAKSLHKDTLSQPIVRSAPYNVNLEYRSVVGNASIHEHEAELIYVLEGGGTFTTGGKLVDEKRTNAENLSGTAIEGGTPQTLAKGDFVILPENTAHWFSAVNGEIVFMSLHLPRSVPAGH